MFENLIGNNKVKETLKSIAEPSHAYMFIGKTGIGKLLFAKEFAYRWLCSSTTKPCGSCKACIQFIGNNNVDFQLITANDGAIKVDQVRELIKRVYEKPVDSYKKIYIVDEADKMTVSAQNALLKVLEEPPVYVIIILIGSNENLFLNTIRSRCIKVKFDDIDINELKLFLENRGENVSEELLELYQGSIGKALKLNGIEEQYLEIKKLVETVNDENKLYFMKDMSKIITKENAIEVFEYMNILMFKLGKEDDKYLNAIPIISKALNKLNLKFNCNLEMIVDNMLLEVCKVI